MDQAIQLDKIVCLTPNCLLIRRDGSETAIRGGSPSGTWNAVES